MLSMASFSQTETILDKQCGPQARYYHKWWKCPSPRAGVHAKPAYLEVRLGDWKIFTLYQQIVKRFQAEWGSKWPSDYDANLPEVGMGKALSLSESSESDFFHWRVPRLCANACAKGFGVYITGGSSRSSAAWFVKNRLSLEKLAMDSVNCMSKVVLKQCDGDKASQKGIQVFTKQCQVNSYDSKYPKYKQGCKYLKHPHLIWGQVDTQVCHLFGCAHPARFLPCHEILISLLKGVAQ